MAKQYEIVNNTTDPLREINMGGHKVKLNNNGKGVVYDPGLAKAIDQKFGYKAPGAEGGKVVVVEVDDLDPRQERGFPTYMRIPGMERIKWKTKAEKEAAERATNGASVGRAD